MIPSITEIHPGKALVSISPAADDMVHVLCFSFGTTMFQSIVYFFFLFLSPRLFLLLGHHMLRKCSITELQSQPFSKSILFLMFF